MPSLGLIYQHLKMMVVNLFLLLLLCLKYTLAVDDQFNKFLFKNSISQATARIVLDFYVKKSPAVVFTAGYVNEMNRLHQSDLINEILQLSSAKGEIKFRLQQFHHISSTNSEQYNVIFIDSYEGFS